MFYPKPLKEGGTIGLVAPSFGIKIEPYLSRYNAAKKRFLDLGYKIIEAPSVYNLYRAASNDAKTRAKEFMDIYLNPDVDVVFSVAGGEIMIDMLYHLDFEKLKDVHKYFIGYSDNTCLTFLLTTLNDVSTIYGQCFPPFGMRVLDESLIDQLDLIKGLKYSFNSYDKYEVNDLKKDDYLAGFNKTEEVVVGYINNNFATGTLLGGCLDVLALIRGTKFDNVKNYTKDKKILWYFEACELNPVAIYRELFLLRKQGWFDTASGFIFGRSFFTDKMFDIDYLTAIKMALEDLNVGIIYNFDIGHLAPTIPILNGSFAKCEVINNKGYISYERK